jgi:hypothetical protein
MPAVPRHKRVEGVVSIVRSSAQKAQMVHNAEVEDVDTDAIAADELWSFVEKNKRTAYPTNSLLETAGSP